MARRGVPDSLGGGARLRRGTGRRCLDRRRWLRWTFRLGPVGGGNFIDLTGPADTPFVRAFGEPILWRVLADGRIRVLTVAPGDYDAVGMPEVVYRCQIRDGEMRWTDGNGPPVRFRPAQPG